MAGLAMTIQPNAGVINIGVDWLPLEDSNLGPVVASLLPIGALPLWRSPASGGVAVTPKVWGKFFPTPL